MAVLTAQGIANIAVPLLSRKLVLPRTVTMVPADGFAPPNGETITVRVRAPRTNREQTTPSADITYDAISQIPVDVTLSHLYDGALISAESLTYEIDRFARDITEPQVDSVAAGAEGKLYAVMNGLSANESFALTASDSNTEDAVHTARETLSNNEIPQGDRFIAAAPDIVTRLLKVDNFVRSDALGDGRSSALRDAVVGRILGFTVVEANGLTAGTMLAYHRSGFAMANKLPEPYLGAVDDAAVTAQGINLRQVFDGVPGKLSSSSVLHTFAGAAAVYEDGTGTNGTDNDRFIKFDTATA